MIMGALLMITVYYLAIYIGYAVGGYRVFKKFGEPGWKAFIPLYNTYVQYSKIWTGAMGILYIVLSVVAPFISNSAGDSVVLTLLSMAVSIAVIVISFTANLKLARSFGHGMGFAIGLTLLQPIFIIILGFSSDEYIGNTTEA